MTESPAVQAALAKFNAALATRKTSHLITMEQIYANPRLARLPVPPGYVRDMAMARPDRPGSDLESVSERQPLIFRGILLMLPVSLVLWWMIGRVVG